MHDDVKNAETSKKALKLNTFSEKFQDIFEKVLEIREAGIQNYVSIIR